MTTKLEQLKNLRELSFAHNYATLEQQEKAVALGKAVSSFRKEHNLPSNSNLDIDAELAKEEAVLQKAKADAENLQRQVELLDRAEAVRAARAEAEARAVEDGEPA